MLVNTLPFSREPLSWVSLQALHALLFQDDCNVFTSGWARSVDLPHTACLLLGTDWKSLLGTILIIVAPCGIFFGFVASKVGSNISWALVAIVAAEMVLALIFLGLTALRDPGFFPRDDPNRPEAKG